MRLKFWGVRGSTPAPGAATLKYGGNTSCIEVRTTGGQLIIFDAGTGIRGLGRSLMRRVPPQGHRIMLFLTHYHWDHIQGLPFFEPLYAPSNYVYLHGFRSRNASIQRVLGEQMANPFFPVDMSVMRAHRNFYTIAEGTLKIGDARIISRRLNHPQGCMGYRIEQGKCVLVYATDHEHGDPYYDKKLRELARGADVLIYDGQFTPEEYKNRMGWGHSTWEEGIKVARDVGVKNLVLFHHDPDHDDATLDQIQSDARRQFPNLHLAMENMSVDLRRSEFRTYGLDKRGKHRLEVPLPISVQTAAGSITPRGLRVTNISLDGAYFLSDRSLQPGKRVQVELEFTPGNSKGKRGKGAVANNNHAQKVITEARVARCIRLGRKRGIGITFR